MSELFEPICQSACPQVSCPRQGDLEAIRLQTVELRHPNRRRGGRQTPENDDAAYVLPCSDSNSKYGYKAGQQKPRTARLRTSPARLPKGETFPNEIQNRSTSLQKLRIHAELIACAMERCQNL